MCKINGMSDVKYFYHFTRGFPNDFKNNGIKILYWNEHSKYIYKKIPEIYKNKFNFLLNSKLNIDEYREGCLWITSKSNPIGTEDLLKYFGGEYVRRLISLNATKNNQKLRDVLSRIGKPLRIKVKLNPQQLSKIDHCDDIYLVSNIPPDSIVEIIEMS